MCSKQQQSGTAKHSLEEELKKHKCIYYHEDKLDGGDSDGSKIVMILPNCSQVEADRTGKMHVGSVVVGWMDTGNWAFQRFDGLSIVPVGKGKKAHKQTGFI